MDYKTRRLWRIDVSLTHHRKSYTLTVDRMDKLLRVLGIALANSAIARLNACAVLGKIPLSFFTSDKGAGIIIFTRLPDIRIYSNNEAIESVLCRTH